MSIESSGYKVRCDTCGFVFTSKEQSLEMLSMQLIRMGWGRVYSKYMQICPACSVAKEKKQYRTGVRQ